MDILPQKLVGLLKDEINSDFTRWPVDSQLARYTVVFIIITKDMMHVLKVILTDVLDQLNQINKSWRNKNPQFHS